MNYPIPHQSKQAFDSSRQQPSQNAGLIFDRFAPDWSREPTLKKRGLETVLDATGKADTDLLLAWYKRWKLAAQTSHASPFTLKTDWRLIVGLGRKGPLEVGFTFNRYGFPIIPGSSLKGLTRAWGFFQIAEKLAVLANLWPDLEKALQGQWQPKLAEWAKPRMDELGRPELWQTLVQVLQIQGEEGKKEQQKALDELLKVAAGDEPAQWLRIFGTQDGAGKAIFFDAIPATRPKVELDIMNPHYPEYYDDKTGTKAPTDWQSPRPVYFLTVAPNTEFCFAVGWRGDKADDALRQVAESWLKAGLTELGAGSKTSAGYGYFQPKEEKPAPKSSSRTKTEVAASTSTPTKSEEPLIWRSGVIVGSIDTSRTRRGKVEDIETKEVYEFPTSVIQGNTPGKKATVEFALQDNKVVALRRK